jgi:hypothetical protein
MARSHETSVLQKLHWLLDWLRWAEACFRSRSDHLNAIYHPFSSDLDPTDRQWNHWFARIRQQFASIDNSSNWVDRVLGTLRCCNVPLFHLYNTFRLGIVLFSENKGSYCRNYRHLFVWSSPSRDSRRSTNGGNSALLVEPLITTAFSDLQNHTFCRELLADLRRESFLRSYVFFARILAW